MRTKHTAVAVHLVDDDVLQSFEELRPFGMVGQNSLVQHIGVGHDDIAVQSHRFTRIARGVAVEGARTHTQLPGFVQFQQFRHLVQGERFGREQIQRFGALGNDRLQYRQVVAERFAGGGWRNHHNMFAGAGAPPGFSLVAVQRVDAALAQAGGEAVIEFAREVSQARGARRNGVFAGDAACVPALKPCEQSLDVGGLACGLYGGQKGAEVVHAARRYSLRIKPTMTPNNSKSVRIGWNAALAGRRK